MKKAFYQTKAALFQALVLLCLSLSSKAAIYPINTVLNGSQEVPANASSGTATLLGTYNDVTNTIFYTISFSGLSSASVQGHFHAPAPPGVNAPVIIPYTGFPAGVTSGTYSNSNIITDAQEVQLLAGLWYANIHTSLSPGGEIRGQVILGAASSLIYEFTNTLTGLQEVPPNASAGTATVTGSYNSDINRIFYTINFSGLSSPTVQGHFHSPAVPGVNAPVIIPFTGFPVGVTSGVYSNSNAITDAQETQLLAGLWYSNIHTSAFPGGEIRAQAILQTPLAVSPYTTCPDATITVARAGTSADINNPYYLYDVNNTTGVMTQVAGGPYKDPADFSKNLQVNAIGLNKKDGFIYGLTNQSTVTTTRFLRLDKTHGATAIGSLPSPTSPTATVGFINSAAGEVDTAGNYYFTAATVNGFTLDKFFLGKISNIGSYPSGAGAIAVSYYEIDISGANCSSWVTSLTTDPTNSGLKDFSYNAYTNSFFTYVTFKPAGSATFKGQLLELRAIAGSSPLKYQLLCNSVINNHTTEVSGTAIDKLGRFTVLFDDGSFGVMNKTSSGVYDGSFTNIATAAVTTLPNPLRGDMASCGQQSLPLLPLVPVTNCPLASYVLARAGGNADTENPYFLYTINTVTGAVTMVPGDGLRYPANPSRFIQVNGIGLNTADGFFYGTAFEGTSSTAELVRFDKMYGVKTLGGITPPVSTTGLFGFVNAAAGDIDRSNNYWFSGFTANLSTLSPTGFIIDKLYLGKIPALSALPISGNPVPQYYEIDVSDANCAGYISTLNIDPGNSGLKDMVYNPFTGTFITYVSFRPTGAGSYSGQMVELKPIAGSTPLKYKMTCTPIIGSHGAEVSGTLIDNAGNFLVVMNDGTVGKIGSTSLGQYNGIFTTLNATPGLPTLLRGDAASCGGPANSPTLPVHLISFTVATKECSNAFTWTADNEVSFNRYEVEQSLDNRTFTTVASVPARKSLSASTYKATLPSAGKAAFYRLKLVDNDGSYSYSIALNVANTCTKNFGFVITPNPVRSSLNMAWYGVTANTQVDLQIFNTTGSLVARTSKAIASGSSYNSIDVNNLAKGAYWIKAFDAKNGMSYQTNFIKQ